MSVTRRIERITRIDTHCFDPQNPEISSGRNHATVPFVVLERTCG
jgi:hypothetical protein